MAKNAAVYARFGGPLAARHWQALVPPGEECLVDLAGDGSGATFVSPDGRITFRRMADDEVPQHLLGLERFLREVGGSDGLIVRALSTSAVYGAVADTELGGGMPGRLALQLADLTEGFCFVDHGRVVDGRGRDLIDEPLRPDLERVMRRAMILLATSFRSVIETAGLDDPATADEASRRLREWLDWVELREEMEDAEREFVTQPAGAVGVEYAANHAFDTEAALGLLWAVGVTELPGLDPARV
ncbi:MAG TPA: hypothetical protein VK020_00990, partial [Microlunatus sp.]|nr:hypothetical protein [Microlunatus sp.]